MHSPFYRSAWDNYSPRYFYYTPRHPQPQPEPEPEPIPSPIMRGVPLHRPQPTQSSKKKVVSVPVHGPGPVRGERALSEPESAVRIQKAFRGYVVRKWVRRVVEIKKEVEDIERRMGDAEVVDKIARDERERLKFNETLMSLLFKLDSVRGVDYAVRDFRRAVIRKAVALQESLDNIPASGGVAIADHAVSRDVAGGGADQASGDGTPVGDDATPPASDVADSESNRGGEEEASAVADVSQQCADDKAAETEDELSDDVAQENADSSQRELVGADVADDDDDDVELNEEGDDRTESQVDWSANPEESMNQAEENAEEEDGGVDESESEMEHDEKDEEGAGGMEKEGEERSRELLERMMEENRKMMRMMAELFERNERQTSLLSTLSNRVEQLEKAYACEKLRRMMKKNKKKRNASVDGFHSAPDCNKKFEKNL